MSTTRQRIEVLFEAALERPSADRVRWVESVCADEPDVAAAVLELLRAHAYPAGILDATPPPLHQNQPAEDARRIGPYRVLRELGRGGMGVVYLATREDESFKRRVAIKLLRDSPDADELYKRFHAERHILASLSHKNIAQLLDGGVADGRLPYLVMEHVEGMPITAYCDRQRLDLRARLQLFTSVCEAVQHAHKNLVLHRDLKPGNILVNEAGEVKLLDFGIAKLLNPVLSDIEQPITRTEQRVLTPQYASPEQIRAESLSTASDVYSLGVILYELLCGALPYIIATRSPAELQELICEREPARPSVQARNSTSAAQVAAQRDTTVPRLTRALRGDLDAIVMMALRKEANRRYGSAELLAEEIGRYLAGLPVAAQRGNAWYRVRKVIRRQRGQVIAAGLVGLSLIGGASAALWQASVARTERSVARTERDRARAALADAQQALQQSRAISAFMTGLFEASDPGDAQGGEATARQLLQRGLRRADQLNDQPLAQAALFDAIARVQKSLGQYSDAHALLERALSIREHQPQVATTDVAETLLQISDLLRLEGRYPEAFSRAREGLAIQERKFGPEHPLVARTQMQLSMLNIYLANKKGAIELAQRAVQTQQRTLAAGDTARVQGLLRLARTYRRFGHNDEAEVAARSALTEVQQTLGTEHPYAAEVMLELSVLLRESGLRLTEAEQLARQAAGIRSRTMGAEHPAAIGAIGDIGEALTAQGRYEEALQFHREQVRLAERVLGPEHPDMTFDYAALASALNNTGRHAEAETMMRRALAIAERRFGPEHSATAGVYAGLSRILLDRGRLDEAERAIRRARDIGERPSGPGSMFNRGPLADVLIRQRRFVEAETELLRGIAIADKGGIQPGHRQYQHLLRALVEVYDSLGRKQDAARYRARLIPAGK